MRVKIRLNENITRACSDPELDRGSVSIIPPMPCGPDVLDLPEVRSLCWMLVNFAMMVKIKVFFIKPEAVVLSILLMVFSRGWGCLIVLKGYGHIHGQDESDDSSCPGV